MKDNKLGAVIGFGAFIYYYLLIDFIGLFVYTFLAFIFLIIWDTKLSGLKMPKISVER